MNSSKAIAATLLIVALLGLAACAPVLGSQSNAEDGASVDVARSQAVEATEENVRLIGRTMRDAGSTWLSQSGSAVEFEATGTRLELELVAEGTATDKDLCPRFAVLVDGEVVVDNMLDDPERTVEVFASDSPKSAVVQVIHLSEARFGAVGVEALDVESDEPDAVVPTKEKDLCIEFIGDSITCGYGVESASISEPFTTAKENFMKTYAYQAAKELDADWSAVCYSGYGVLSGWTGDGTRNSDMLVPPLYGLVAEEYDEPWDFDAHVYHAVVINLGTNDITYTGTDTERMQEFASTYEGFLEQVREHNPTAYIVCTMGTMGHEEIYPYVEQAVDSFKAKTGDTQVTCYLSERMDVENDGAGTNEHPTAVTQTKSAQVLAEVIREALGAAA